MKYKIARPSFRRIDKIQTHTLKMLRECNIKDKEIYIFLADKQDYDLYKKEICGDYNFILGVPYLSN